VHAKCQQSVSIGTMASVARLLDEVTTAAREVRESEARAAQARERLREAMRRARAEGLSFAAIGRAAGISRQRVRVIVHGD
jgi:hypothetical protein